MGNVLENVSYIDWSQKNLKGPPKTTWNFFKKKINEDVRKKQNKIIHIFSKLDYISFLVMLQTAS